MLGYALFAAQITGGIASIIVLMPLYPALRAAHIADCIA